MLSTLPILALLPLGALAATAHPRGAANLTPFLSNRDVSPDNTCGPENGGDTCPGELPCCSQFGFCGATDAFCLTTANCQPDYSNSTEACYAPVPGETVSIDGTCGTTGAGTEGYVCPGNATVTSCCSVAGYCGDTSAHCSAAKGCQADYGNCTAAATPSSSSTAPPEETAAPLLRRFF